MVSFVQPYADELWHTQVMKVKTMKTTKTAFSRYFTWSISRGRFREWLVSNHYLFNAIFLIQVLWPGISLCPLLQVCVWRVRKGKFGWRFEYRCCQAQEKIERFQIWKCIGYWLVLYWKNNGKSTKTPTLDKEIHFPTLVSQKLKTQGWKVIFALPSSTWETWNSKGHSIFYPHPPYWRVITEPP